MVTKGVRGKYHEKYNTWVKLTKPQTVVKTRKSETYHEGANDERSAILAKVRREIKKVDAVFKDPYQLKLLESWLLKRNERAKARPGGL